MIRADLGQAVPALICELRRISSLQLDLQLLSLQRIMFYCTNRLLLSPLLTNSKNIALSLRFLAGYVSVS